MLQDVYTFYPLGRCQCVNFWPEIVRCISSYLNSVSSIEYLLAMYVHFLRGLGPLKHWAQSHSGIVKWRRFQISFNFLRWRSCWASGDACLDIHIELTLPASRSMCSEYRSTFSSLLKVSLPMCCAVILRISATSCGEKRRPVLKISIVSWIVCVIIWHFSKKQKLALSASPMTRNRSKSTSKPCKNFTASWTDWTWWERLSLQNKSELTKLTRLFPNIVMFWFDAIPSRKCRWDSQCWVMNWSLGVS